MGAYIFICYYSPVSDLLFCCFLRAGKSTSLAIMAGLSGITSGTVTFEGGYDRPPRGLLGIVPQKNVLFSDLTCLQNLQVWRAVKWSTNRYETDADLEQLLQECDLAKKIHANADTLSGGQKRKLQLAIGLLGGSKSVFPLYSSMTRGELICFIHSCSCG